MINKKDYNILLYEKLMAEYENCIKELKSMSPDEIISHSYEKTFKEELLLYFEYDNLPQEKAKALYKLKNPLEDLYKSWLKSDVSYIDLIRDTIDERAKTAIKDMKKIKEEIR